MSDYKTIEELKGKTLENIEVGNDEVVFSTTDGKRYQMYHRQDCCESVWLDKTEGDPRALIGSPILIARESPGHGDMDGRESATFSDFELETENANVVFHWIGESNGYYDESVYFIEL